MPDRDSQSGRPAFGRQTVDALFAELVEPGSVAVIKGHQGTGKVLCAERFFPPGEHTTWVKGQAVEFGEAAGAKKMLEQKIREGTKVVVFESWTTLTNELDEGGKARLGKSLANMAQAKGVQLVLILDGEEENSIDALADSIVLLRRIMSDVGLVREIEWIKFKGVDRREVALFTLRDGRFETIPSPPRWMPPKEHSPVRPVSNAADSYSTGSVEVDEFLGGGLRKGSVTLIETGKSLGMEWVLTLMASVSINFISSGGCLLALPSMSTFPDAFLGMIQPFVRPTAFRNNIRLLSFAYSYSTHVTRLSGDSKKDVEEVHKIMESLKRGTLVSATGSDEDDEMDFGEEGGPPPSKECLFFLSLDNYQAHKEAESDQRPVLRMIEDAKADGGIAVLASKPSTTNIQMFSDLSDLHLYLDQVDGCLVVYAKRPRGDPQAITFEYADGVPKMRMIPLL